MTTQDLAQEIDIDRSTLTRIINGTTTNPHSETVYTIAKYFNINVDYLLNSEYSQSLSVNVKDSLTNNKIKDILANLLNSAGVNMITIQKHTGIPKSVLSEILSGKTEKPAMKTLEKLANYFGISVPQLVGINVIPSGEIISITPDQATLALIELNMVNLWFSEQNFDGIRYINFQLPGLSSKAFAVKICDRQYSPDFELGETVVVEPAQSPDDFDFIVYAIDDSIHIGEIEILDDGYIIRRAGQLKHFHVSFDNIRIYGVIIKRTFN